MLNFWNCRFKLIVGRFCTGRVSLKTNKHGAKKNTTSSVRALSKSRSDSFCGSLVVSILLIKWENELPRSLKVIFLRYKINQRKNIFSSKLNLVIVLHVYSTFILFFSVYS